MDEPGGTACKDCTPGLFQASRSADGPRAAAERAERAGQRWPKQAAAVSTRRVLEHEQCERCPAPFLRLHARRAQSLECRLCPLGRFNSRLGVTICTLCDPGKIADTQGSLTCSGEPARGRAPPARARLSAAARCRLPRGALHAHTRRTGVCRLPSGPVEPVHADGKEATTRVVDAQGTAVPHPGSPPARRRARASTPPRGPFRWKAPARSRRARQVRGCLRACLSAARLRCPCRPIRACGGPRPVPQVPCRALPGRASARAGPRAPHRMDGRSGRKRHHRLPPVREGARAKLRGRGA
jgi:hypothetical protein